MWFGFERANVSSNRVLGLEEQRTEKNGRRGLIVDRRGLQEYLFLRNSSCLGQGSWSGVSVFVGPLSVIEYTIFGLNFHTRSYATISIHYRWTEFPYQELRYYLLRKRRGKNSKKRKKLDFTVKFYIESLLDNILINNKFNHVAIQKCNKYEETFYILFVKIFIVSK